MNDDWINHNAPPNGIAPVCKYCNCLVDWISDHDSSCKEYRDEPAPKHWVTDRIDVSWDHSVDPPVPLVTTLETAADGFLVISLKDKDESLRLMWAEIKRLGG